MLKCCVAFRRSFLVIAVLLVLSGCTQQAPYGLTLNADKDMVVVTRGCRPLSVHLLEIGTYGADDTPGTADDRILWKAVGNSPIAFTSLRLEDAGMLGFRVSGMTPSQIGDRTDGTYLHVVLARNGVEHHVAFTSSQLTSRTVKSSRVKPFGPVAFCR